MKKNIKNTIVTLLIALALIILIPISTQAKSASLSKSKLTLIKGTSYTLKVKRGKAKSYSSTKASVAKVTRKGKITARKKGSATIKVKVGNKVLKCKVKVIEGDLSTKSINVKAKSSEVLKYVGTGTASKCVIADETVASVTNNGDNTFSIIGLKAGTTEAQVYIGDSVLKCAVTVTASEPVYAWVKKGVVKNVPSPKTEGVYSYSYYADIPSATVKEDFSGYDNSGNKVSSTFTTKCTAPVDTLKADEVIKLNVSMNMSAKTKDVGSVYRIYVTWNGCNNGTVDYNSGTKFSESKEMYLNCSQNQDFAMNLDAEVSYTVPKGGSIGEQRAVVFNHFGGPSIAWIYEWKQVE